MRITALAGGIGGARFLRGVLAARPNDDVTVIGNTGDDIWIHGLRVCPDLDTVMYTLGGGISIERGWGREGETFTVKEELAEYGVEPTWFGLGDKDIATHLVSTSIQPDPISFAAGSPDQRTCTPSPAVSTNSSCAIHAQRPPSTQPRLTRPVVPSRFHTSAATVPSACASRSQMPRWSERTRSSPKRPTKVPGRRSDNGDNRRDSCNCPAKKALSPEAL